MAEFNLKIMADDLGKSLENLAPQVEEQINVAVQDLAQAAYASIVNRVQSSQMNPKNRAEYMRALEIQQLGDSEWIIYLDSAHASKFEDGFGSYSIRDELLKSNKTVQVGSRAGEPWVRQASDGHKWAVVPFEHKPFSAQNTSGDLGTDIKKLMAKNMSGREQPLTKIFKDLGDKPISGKVASVKSTGNKYLDGITKFQHVSDSGKVSSIYMTFRAVSEQGPDWINPGFEGYGYFKEAEAYVERELQNIINTLL